MDKLAIEIEEGVEIPPKIGTRKYPYATMKVGQSFALVKEATTFNRMSGSAQQYAKRWGGKFVLRNVVEDGVEKVRAWRVE